jgi:hypothetical protein
VSSRTTRSTAGFAGTDRTKTSRSSSGARAVEHNRRALTSPLVVVRVDAILRLSRAGAAPEDREAARQTLLRLLDNRRVPNAAKRYLRDHAAREGWLIDGDAQDGGLAPRADASAARDG